LDVGIHYLGDPWGLYDLPKAQQAELLAYWKITHSDGPIRWYLSGPATLRDIWAGIRLNKGKAAEYFKTPAPPEVVQNIAKRTSADPNRVKWWFSEG